MSIVTLGNTEAFMIYCQVQVPNHTITGTNYYHMQSSLDDGVLYCHTLSLPDGRKCA